MRCSAAIILLASAAQSFTPSGVVAPVSSPTRLAMMFLVRWTSSSERNNSELFGDAWSSPFCGGPIDQLQHCHLTPISTFSDGQALQTSVSNVFMPSPISPSEKRRRGASSFGPVSATTTALQMVCEGKAEVISLPKSLIKNAKYYDGYLLLALQRNAGLLRVTLNGTPKQLLRLTGLAAAVTVTLYR